MSYSKINFIYRRNQEQEVHLKSLSSQNVDKFHDVKLNSRVRNNIMQILDESQIRAQIEAREEDIKIQDEEEHEIARRSGSELRNQILRF